MAGRIQKTLYVVYLAAGGHKKKLNSTIIGATNYVLTSGTCLEKLKTDPGMTSKVKHIFSEAHFDMISCLGHRGRG